MRGKLSMRKISEILRQKYELGSSYRNIAQSLNISISTISEYIARAKAAGITWPLTENMTEEVLYDKLFLPTNHEISKRDRPSWEWVHKELRKKGVTLLLLWHEFKAIHPEGIGYTRFCIEYTTYSKSISHVM